MFLLAYFLLISYSLIYTFKKKNQDNHIEVILLFILLQASSWTGGTHFSFFLNMPIHFISLDTIEQNWVLISPNQKYIQKILQLFAYT